VREFLDRLAASEVKGKYAAAFGSFGWSGEGPYLLALRLEQECGMKMVSEPLRAKQGIKDADLHICRAPGSWDFARGLRAADAFEALPAGRRVRQARAGRSARRPPHARSTLLLRCPHRPLPRRPTRP